MQDGEIKNTLEEISGKPSAYWLDTIEKLTDAETMLQDIQSSNYTAVVFIVYNLPNRDCHAVSSNGELCCDQTCATKENKCDWDKCMQGTTLLSCQDSLNIYKEKYIDQLVTILNKYPKIKKILIIEPDSMANIAADHSTDSARGCLSCDDNLCTGLSKTAAVYADGITYALQNLSIVPNTYMYLDAGHNGWLGWDFNISRYRSIIKTQGWNKYIHGFTCNVANYQELGEPSDIIDETAPFTPMIEQGSTPPPYGNWVSHLQQSSINDPCQYVTQYNAAFNLLNYVKILYWATKDLDFVTEDKKPHFVIDTARNGNPNVLTDTQTCAHWCNMRNARQGKNPQANPYREDCSSSPALCNIDAYFWLKTPGESDGCIDPSTQTSGKCTAPSGTYSCARYDSDCGSYASNIGTGSGEPCPPEAGAWFDYQILMLAGVDDPTTYQCTPPPTAPTAPATRNHTLIRDLRKKK